MRPGRVHLLPLLAASAGAFGGGARLPRRAGGPRAAPPETPAAAIGSPAFRLNPRPVPPPLRAEGRPCSSDLDTACEWLAEERSGGGSGPGGIDWIDPSATMSDHDDAGIRRMPLYPLGAVHVPHSGENHTIVNIEPKNVKMAVDLANGEWDDSLFCATLRARDTGRIASVGTAMRLLDTEDRSISGARTWPGDVLPTLSRVVANCRAVGVVDIIAIEDRDYGKDDYLIAKVRVRNPPRESDDNADIETNGSVGDDRISSIAAQIAKDYRRVRSIYINSQSLASNELPKFARKAVRTLPAFDASDVIDEGRFWRLVETWQMLCNTIRQSRQTRLQGIVNELSVSAAMRTRGPLELPVKRGSLPADVRRQLGEIERDAAREFAELGMDPVLDFQGILSAGGHADRAERLAGMIGRERSRLEAKESLIRAFAEGEGLGDGGRLLGARPGGDADAFD